MLETLLSFFTLVAVSEMGSVQRFFFGACDACARPFKILMLS